MSITVIYHAMSLTVLYANPVTTKLIFRNTIAFKGTYYTQITIKQIHSFRSISYFVCEAVVDIHTQQGFEYIGVKYRMFENHAKITSYSATVFF
jgi:hypothetical protein